MRLLGEATSGSDPNAVLVDGSRNVQGDLTFEQDIFMDSPTPVLTIGDGTDEPVIRMQCAFNRECEIHFAAAGFTRWVLRGFDDADNGLKFGRSNAVGGFQGWALQLANANGDATFENDIYVGGQVQLNTYTVATLPAVGIPGAGSLIYVSDETGGATVAFSDGTNWRRVQDRAIVS